MKCTTAEFFSIHITRIESKLMKLFQKAYKGMIEKERKEIMHS